MPRTTATQRRLITNFGTSLSFNGSTNAVVPALWSTAKTNVSMAAWFRTADFKGTRQPIISNGSSASSNHGYALVIGNGSTTDGTIYILDHTIAFRTLGFKIQDNLWHHIVMTVDGTTGVKVYLDGVLRYNQATTIGTPSASSAIGADGAGFFRGGIKDARFYNIELTATDVVNLFNGIEPATVPLNWYKFNEGSGTTALDSGSAPKDGTAGGNTYPTYSTDIPFGVRSAIAATRMVARNYGNAIRTVAASAQSITWTNTPFLVPRVVSATFWMKLRAAPSSSFDIPFGFGNDRWYFIFNGATFQPMFHVDAPTEKGTAASASNVVKLNKWFMYAGTYDPDAGSNNITLRVYDEFGSLVFATAATITGDMGTAANVLAFGRDPARALNMSIDGDEPHVYSRVLTTTEQDNLALGYEPDPTGLMMWGKCDESSGDVTDYSGNGRTGTNQNTTTFVTSFRGGRSAVA